MVPNQILQVSIYPRPTFESTASDLVWNDSYVCFVYVAGTVLFIRLVRIGFADLKS